MSCALLQGVDMLARKEKPLKLFDLALAAAFRQIVSHNLAESGLKKLRGTEQQRTAMRSAQLADTACAKGLEVMRTAQACVHLALATAFAAVWGWHLTPQANSQEVAKKFGWFFNYLTFFSFSVQLIQFFVCLLADLKPKRQLVSISNDLSCSVFGMAVFVTISYYYLLFKGEIEDSDKAPAWISPVLHTGNVLAAVADLWVSTPNRTFHMRALVLSQSLVIGYLGWCIAAKHVDGSFPYDFMNDMEQPSGMMKTAAALMAIVAAIFMLARVSLVPKHSKAHSA